MKRYTRRAFWICFLLVLVFLACRLLWLASQTETGLDSLSQTWRDATYGVLFGKQEAISSQEPAIQADYWLEEADRLLKAHGDNAQLTMGAALVLDNPGSAYSGRYLKKYYQFPGFPAFPEMDSEGLSRAAELFESKCADRCLELAARATEIEPTNPQWWRLRALLLVRYPLFFSDESPRDSKWLEILDECSRHDGDNALYDYLAASIYWQSSAKIEFSKDNDLLVIKDAERFKRGISRFERGLEKSSFASSDTSIEAISNFLTYTKTPLEEHKTIIESRGIESRFRELLRELWRFQNLRAEGAAQAGQPDAALAMQRQNLHLMDQCNRSSESKTYNYLATELRIVVCWQIDKIANEHKDLLSAEELKEFNNLEKDTRLNQKVVEEVDQRLGEGIINVEQEQKKRLKAAKSALSTNVFIVGLSPPAIIILLLVGVISVTISFYCKSADLPTIGSAWLFLSFSAALLLTFVIFGLAPAKIIGTAIQAWFLTILLIAVPVVLAFWIGWKWLWRRDFKATFRAVAISAFVLCILFGIALATMKNFDSFTKFPFELSVPVCSWDGWRAENLEYTLRPLGSWIWAVTQWDAYHGQCFTVVLWVMFVAGLLYAKIKRTKRDDNGQPMMFRNRMGALARSVGKPSLILAGLLLLAYLTLAPGVMAIGEENYQQNMEPLRQPSIRLKKREEAMQEVRSDKELMLQLEEAVLKEMEESRDLESSS